MDYSFKFNFHLNFSFSKNQLLDITFLVPWIYLDLEHRSSNMKSFGGWWTFLRIDSTDSLVPGGLVESYFGNERQVNSPESEKER